MNKRGKRGVGGLWGREKNFICRNTNKTSERFHLVYGVFVSNHGRYWVNTMVIKL